MSRDRRVRRDQPYLDEHRARASELARPPRSFGDLLTWFLEGFWAETPERMHSRGVWATTRRLDAQARPTEDVKAAEQGGSVLGSPRYAEPFRQLLENSDRQWTDERGTVDPYYVRPMRAALARMARPEGSDSAFMARFLLQVAFAGGDWQSVADRWELKPYVRLTYIDTALRRLRNCWRREPPLSLPGWVDRSEAQRTAETATDREGNVA